MIGLGAIVRDKETEFQGIVTARSEYLYDAPKVLVENIDTTGRPIEVWYNEERVYEIDDEEYELEGISN